MAAYVIHYDLNKGDRAHYQELYDALVKAKAVRATESTWFIVTTWDAIKLRDWLQKHLHEKDVIAVNVLTARSGYATKNLPEAARAWMKQHLSPKEKAIAH